MYVVAIHGPRTDERLSEVLVEVTGRTPAEARARLNVPGTGPLVVAVLSDRAQAVDLGRRLQAAGFQVLAVGPEHIETDADRIIARSFSLDEGALIVTPRQGDPVSVPLGAASLVLFGTSSSVHTDITNEKSRKLSLGRIAMTGGLVARKTVVKQVVTEEQIRGRFAYVRAPDLPTVALHEASLQADGPGVPMHRSRTASFTHLMAELRRLCTGAIIDDRLLNRGTQSMLLGPMLGAEEHLDVATTLLIRSLLL